jgi:Protein of unknown function (DUF3644)
VFAVLANIAWTYLLHEHYERKGIPPLNADGTTFALSHMLSRQDCLLSKGIKNNLLSLKAIRDDVEHKTLGRSDVKWLPLFQACCLNFDKTLVGWFGPRVSLRSDLSVALQFGKLELASKGKAHIQFLSPDSAEGKSVQNVLQKFKIADELCRYKPGDVTKIVRKASEKSFHNE